MCALSALDVEISDTKDTIFLCDVININFKASMNGRTEVVEVLLKADASIDIVDKGGNTAIMEAAEKGHVDVAARLFDAGALRDRLPRPLFLLLVVIRSSFKIKSSSNFVFQVTFLMHIYFSVSVS